MPWDIASVDKHKKGLSLKQKKKWVAVANSVLQSSGDDATAIKIANSKCVESNKDLARRLIDESPKEGWVAPDKIVVGDRVEAGDEISVIGLVVKFRGNLVVVQSEETGERYEFPKSEIHNVWHRMQESDYCSVCGWEFNSVSGCSNPDCSMHPNQPEAEAELLEPEEAEVMRQPNRSTTTGRAGVITGFNVATSGSNPKKHLSGIVK